MLKTKSDNPNYLARIVRLPETVIHPNADKLLLTTIQAQNIIVGKDVIPGQLYILFQLETKINSEFLSYINGFSDPELNRDKTKRGFFSRSSGRVKACKLRGILSEGYLHPLNDFNDWLKSKNIKYIVSDKDLDKDFDSVGDLLFVEKYINQETLRKSNLANKVKGGKVKRESRLVEKQFRLSPDYRHLKREINTINPDDFIDLTSKWHGANCVISKILTKRKLSILDKLAKKLGIKILESEYSLVFSSRTLIKNEFADQQSQGFYSHNIWEIVAHKYQDCLQDGVTAYGELVGFTPSGAGVQSLKGKVFDYGCEPGKCDFIVFRLTYTSPAGNVYEFSLPQVIDYCQKVGLKHIPVYYIGKAKDKYPELDTQNHWHENFLNKLIEEYLEKDDIYCKTAGLPDEGIVLSKRIGGFEGLKLKSARFILGESEKLDSGEINIEDSESQNLLTDL